jgi:hypothetical protein
MSKIINKLNYLTTFASQQIHPRPRRSLSTFRLSTEPRRMRWLGLLFSFNFALLISACGLDIEDPTPPSPPVWVQKSLPEEWPERGIDAHESGGIYLEWESSAEEDITTYKIYRATWYDISDSLGNYNLVTNLETEFISKMEYIDTGAQIGIPYYYKLKVEDASDNQSKFSDSLFYSLIPQLNIWMIPNGSSATLGNIKTLSWGYQYSIEMEYFCLTILTGENEFIYRDIFLPGDYINGHESWQIPTDVVLDYGWVYQWRIDTGARYIDDRETSGSESAWATFIYVGD